MKVIGITGGIGAGKSTVARMLKWAGYPVYDSDTRAKALVNEDNDLRASVIAYFGNQVYSPDGQLNRAALGAKVFSNPEALQHLNSLVHPAVKRDFASWVKIQSAKGCSIAFKEAALIFEAGTEDSLDAVWVVSAPKEVRIQRVAKRDDLSREQIQDRINRQIPEEEKRKRANHIIENDGSFPLAPQLRFLLKKEKNAQSVN